MTAHYIRALKVARADKFGASVLKLLLVQALAADAKLISSSAAGSLCARSPKAEN